MSIEQTLKNIANIKVAVIGDVMLDTYCWGNVDRVSPEAPVPVVVLDKKEYRIGGAGNVGLNTVSLGAETFIFSVIGKDDDGNKLKELMQKNNIKTDFLFTSAQRVTTNKTRIISRNQQMLRIDAEIVENINADEEKELLAGFKKFVTQSKPDVVIIEDYNKGVLTETIIAAVMEVCKENNIVTAVDPKRKNFFAFNGATIFKPNLKEVREALNLFKDDVNEEALNAIHLQLQEALNNKYSVITLSEKGIYYQGDTENKIIPSHRRNISDVSGAGDTVIAVTSLVYAVSKDIHLAADVANIAGGLVCEQVGTVAIDKQQLIEECKALIA